MSQPKPPEPEEIEHLLRNAQLRDELEPYLDEAILRVNVQEIPTPVENEFLASMLAWERAPVLAISQWFEPELVLPHPDSFPHDADGELQLHEALWAAIEKLHSQRIVLDFTDHLSDRQLYTLVFRDILPAPEKKIASSQSFLHWDCADMGENAEIWLRYYASEEERQQWSEETGDELPERQTPPHPRHLPQQPL